MKNDWVNLRGYCCQGLGHDKSHLQIVQYLIEKCANIEAKDYAENTTLHWACFINDLPIVQYLIEKGVNVEANNEDQSTPLYLPINVLLFLMLH